MIGVLFLCTVGAAVLLAALAALIRGLGVIATSRARGARGRRARPRTEARRRDAREAEARLREARDEQARRKRAWDIADDPAPGGFGSGW